MTTCRGDRRNFLSHTIKTAAATAASVWLGTGPSPSFAATTPSGKIASRLEPGATLVLPQPSYSSELNGVDNTYYPDWLAGEWDVTQTLVDAQTPLGLKFVGGPNGLIDIAEKTMAEAKLKVSTDRVVSLSFVVFPFACYESRSFLTDMSHPYTSITPSVAWCSGKTSIEVSKDKVGCSRGPYIQQQSTVEWICWKRRRGIRAVC